MKTQEFLANAGIEPKVIIDAKKDVHQKTEALKLVSAATSVHAARGKKIVEIDTNKSDATEEEILKVVLGPTGNLRAPTLVMGKKLVVGFNDQMYAGLFG